MLLLYLFLSGGCWNKPES